MSLDFEVVRKNLSEVLAHELSAWQQLIDANVDHQRAFLSPCFCQAVQATGVRVIIVFLKRGLSITGVLALMPQKSLAGLLGVYEPVGGEMTDYFGLIAVPWVKVSINDLLLRSGIGCVVFNHLDETQFEFGLHGENPRIGLRTRIQGTGGEHWEALRSKDKKLVSDTERRERKLQAEHGELVFELRSSRPEADLNELITLKKAQYGRTGKHAAPLFDETNVNLLRELLHSRDPQCAALLSVLRVNGRLVAAHFGLQCIRTLHFWFPAYEEAFSAYSPGRILYRHILEEASDIGVTLVDRGEGDTKAKRDFANEEHFFYMGVWHVGIRGFVARLVLALTWRIQAWRAAIGKVK